MTKEMLLSLLATQLALGQAVLPKPEFEVAAIKLCAGNGNGGGTRPNPGRLNMGCQSIQALIQMAYGMFSGETNSVSNINLRRMKVIGAPEWVASESYVISAKAEERTGVGKMMGPMLQALLEDRLQLKVHRETREMPLYALTVAKGSTKLQPLKEGACVPLDLDNLPEEPAPGKPMLNFCGRQIMRMMGQLQKAEIIGTTIANFAGGLLSERLDRPVVDRTGLEGLFDIRLEFTLEYLTADGAGRGGQGNSGTSVAGPIPGVNPAGPSLFTAVQEQLGLKLSAVKGPIEVLVIDHIEKPSAN